MATIDWEQFNENFQYYDAETVSEVIENFFEELDERMSTLEKNIGDNDMGSLSFNAHSLKSVIGNFMAPRPYELSRNIELLAKEGSAATIPTLYAELKVLCYELKEELAAYLKSKS
jgi:HPt (histidine-containing phosphotransfer) domain-containing protein